MNESAKAWKLANPDKVKEQKARWYKKHRDSILEKDKARARPTTEKHREQIADWKKSSRDLCRGYDQNRRAKKVDQGGVLSVGLADKLFKLQKGKCPCCALPLGDDYHLDHKMPLALGGSNTDDNMQLLRAICNQQKHAKHPVDFMQSRGFLL